MIDYNVEVKKEFNKHHNLAKVQEKFPQLNPASIVHYALGTAVYQYTSKPDKDESKIKTLDLTNIKPNITHTNIITNIDDKDIKFISGGREINITGRKTINYQELFYMVLIEGRSLGYIMNIFTCNEYSILKGLQFL